MKSLIKSLMVMMMLSGFSVQAMEEQHTEHGSSKQAAMAAAQPRMLPSSGTVQEAGYQGNHVYASTQMTDDFTARCRQGRLGLRMLTRKEWQACAKVKSPALEKPIMKKAGPETMKHGRGHQH